MSKPDITMEQRRRLFEVTLQCIRNAKADPDPAIRKQAEEFEPTFVALLLELEPKAGT